MRGPVLIVPPLVRYAAGPLLGPAMLAGAAAREGLDVEVVDLNICYLRRLAEPSSAPLSRVCGDHAKPSDGFRRARAAHRQAHRAALPAAGPGVPAGQDPIEELMFSFDQVERAALVRASDVDIASLCDEVGAERPAWIGMSIMFAGQVLDGLALSLLLKKRWPGVPVIWGGAHVTLLAQEVADDARYGHIVDGFVAGYAERTFVELCRLADPRAHPSVILAGSGTVRRASGGLDAVPAFGDLGRYGEPRLTLPAQTSRGCAYGRCRFCTYPVVEGEYAAPPIDALHATVAVAASAKADIAFKDALLTGPRLDDVARTVDGVARFAVTTRVRPRLGRERLARAAAAGLATMEFGVETTDPERLRMLDKKQALDDLRRVLDDVHGLDVHVVLNLMFGYPGQSGDQADAELHAVLQVVAQHGGDWVTTERNLLQVQRSSPLSAHPERYGVHIIGSWPWATSLGWNAPDWRSDATSRFTGHFQAEPQP